ncbi:AraC family transcriptional regulator [Paenibacillus sp. SI8]|uniref:helix-turn-helix transcriptional regulator n=1 Tax=unclassified Paenibacillus TaxID=185978 RepID=UPI003466A85C
MNRMVNPIPQFAERHFLFFLHEATRETCWENINAHQGIEIVFILEGSGHVILDQKMHEIGPGTLLICQPYQLHHFKMNPPYVRTPLIFDPYLFDRFVAPFPSLQTFFRKIWKDKLKQQVFSLTEAERSRYDELFCEFHIRLQGLSDFAKKEELTLFLLRLLTEMRKLYALDSKKEIGSAGKREGRHIEQMMSWIEDHYHEDFSLERLADNLHLSPFYASHLFKEETGFTLSQYIMARRIREACLLLPMTDWPIVQIGLKIGFNSSAYFCKSFKKKMGISPQMFRKQSGHR